MSLKHRAQHESSLAELLVPIMGRTVQWHKKFCEPPSRYMIGKENEEMYKKVTTDLNFVEREKKTEKISGQRIIFSRRVWKTEKVWELNIL